MSTIAPVDAPWRATDADRLEGTSDYLRVEPRKDGWSNSPLLWGLAAGSLGASVHLLNGGGPLNGKAMALTALVVGGAAAGVSLLTKLDNGSSRTVHVEGATGLAALRDARPDLAEAAEAELEKQRYVDAAPVADDLLETFDADGDDVIAPDERQAVSANGHDIELMTGLLSMNLDDDESVDRRRLIAEVGTDTEVKVDQQGAGDVYLRIDGFTRSDAADFTRRR